MTARMHTAEHIFFRALQEEIPTLELDKIDLKDNESSLFVKAPKLELEKILKAEKKTNKIIKENRPVKESNVSKNDHEALKGIRIKLDRIKEDTVRVIEIEGHDRSACSGEHVKNTGEVGGILVTRFNSLGKGRYEIRFKVDFKKDLFHLADLARQLKEVLETDYDLIVQSAKNLKEEHKKLKEKVRELSAKIPVKINEEKINNTRVYTAELPGVEKKQFIEKINSLNGDNYVACFLNDNTIAVRAEGKNASEILKKILEQTGGRGGGNQKLAQGSVEKKENVFEALKESLS